MTSDGAIVVAGSSGMVGRSFKRVVVRLTPTGQRDSSFGGPIALPASEARGSGLCEMRAAGGRIFVAYSVDGATRILGLSAAGVPDASFGGAAGVVVAGFGRAMIVRPSGAIDVLTTTYRDNFVLSPLRRSMRIVRLASSGTIDPTFGTDGAVEFSPLGYVSFSGMLPGDADETALFEAAGAGEPTPIHVQRVDATGRRVSTTTLAPRFGGGAPFALSGNGFGGALPTRRVDGSYVVVGAVSVLRFTEGGTYGSATFAAAAVTSRLAPDRSFGGPLRAPLVRLRANMTSTAAHARGGAVPVLVTTSLPGVLQVTIRAVDGQVLGSTTAPIFSAGTSPRAIHLTDAGRLLLTRPGPTRVAMTYDFGDVLAAHARGRTVLQLP